MYWSINPLLNSCTCTVMLFTVCNYDYLHNVDTVAMLAPFIVLIVTQLIFFLGILCLCYLLEE